MKIIPVTYKSAARSPNIFFALFEKQRIESAELFSYLPKSVQTAVRKLAKEEFMGEAGETKSIWFPKGNIKRVRLFGLGDKSKWNYRKEHLLARMFTRYAKSERIKEFAAELPSSSDDARRDASLFTTNALMADFEFNKYKERPKTGWPEIRTVNLAAHEGRASLRSQSEWTAPKDAFKSARDGIRDGMIIGEEVNSCRALANTPGGDMTPKRLADEAVQTAKKYGILVKILNEKDMQRLNMGGVLGVARGSSEKPQFIILEYFHGPQEQKPLVLTGKGVTFDTGGLNLKPSDYIYEMHMDMSGGAAVIHGMAAVARLKLPINVVGLIPAVENMPSGSSYHPGDLLKTMSGKTIEVLNTDAEGRVILADALYYGATKYKPGLMVNFATLTGAAHVALGSHCSALFTKDGDESLERAMIDVGKKSGDYVWPLPLWDEFLPEIKGTFGDLANIGAKDKYGGATHGAKFLEQFAGETHFAHIDIAPRMTAVEADYLGKGAAGTGVRYIVELAKEYPHFISE
ncbi:MAG: leucyl aminopeptidase family protein [Candidatus Sungbacteria bacterium]|nr:leucyl aminopeptidase family protein [Candidatus Sungbacteria bacterium]